MALDERARHELFLRLEEVLGPAQAETLMEMMPPVGWADVATKRDLDALEQRVDLRFEAMEHKVEAVEHKVEAVEHKLLAAFPGRTADHRHRADQDPGTGQPRRRPHDGGSRLRSREAGLTGVVVDPPAHR